jgi:hypothetical protein
MKVLQFKPGDKQCGSFMGITTARISPIAIVNLWQFLPLAVLYSSSDFETVTDTIPCLA